MMKGKYLENPTKETVQELARILGKPERSVISKLSREGVYKRTKYVTKTGDDVVTKTELVASISQYLEVDTDKLLGLDKAPKPVLKLILHELEQLLGKPM